MNILIPKRKSFNESSRRKSSFQINSKKSNEFGISKIQTNNFLEESKKKTNAKFLDKENEQIKSFLLNNIRETHHKMHTEHQEGNVNQIKPKQKLSLNLLRKNLPDTKLSGVNIQKKRFSIDYSPLTFNKSKKKKSIDKVKHRRKSFSPLIVKNSSNPSINSIPEYEEETKTNENILDKVFNIETSPSINDQTNKRSMQQNDSLFRGINHITVYPRKKSYASNSELPNVKSSQIISNGTLNTNEYNNKIIVSKRDTDSFNIKTVLFESSDEFADPHEINGAYNNTDENFIVKKTRQIKSHKNVYDSLEDDEVDVFLDANKWYIIYPSSLFKLSWDLVCTVLILYSMIYSPYVTAFINTEEFSFFSFDMFLDLFFFNRFNNNLLYSLSRRGYYSNQFI